VILLLDTARSPKTLRLLLPKLDQKGWRYISNPFLDSEPVRIEAVRLLCPPFRGNSQEAAKLSASPVNPAPFVRSFRPSACEWEITLVQSGGEVIWPTPEDAAVLRALVE